MRKEELAFETQHLREGEREREINMMKFENGEMKVMIERNYVNRQPVKEEQDLREDNNTG